MVLKKAKKKSASSDKKKSGIRNVSPSEILFHEGDKADSLYIIQSGQIRLYKPKGKGFIELAVLRAGEVLGEMAYFSEEDSDGKRSCSAMAIIKSVIIEISFVAFGRTMNNLNPWFKTIITTLAKRLRKTNDKIRELESNSVAIGYGEKSTGYTFLRSQEVIRLFSALYLIMKTHGEVTEGGTKLSEKVIKLYSIDIFNLHEVKLEEFLDLLVKMELLSVETDEKTAIKSYSAKDVESFHSLLTFFNSQRIQPDEKKIVMPAKTLTFLEGILKMCVDTKSEEEKIELNINPLVEKYKEEKVDVSLSDLDPAINKNILTEVMIGEENSLSTKIHYALLKKIILPMQITEEINKLNIIKSKG